MSEPGVVHLKPLTPGERVVAVSSSGEDDHIHIFGFGIYQGDDVVGKEAVGPVSALARATSRLTPRITLDDGNIVWGSECHIMREEELQEMLSADGIKGVAIRDLSEVRAKAPNFLVVRFFTPPDRNVQYLPMEVSIDTFRRMEALESLGRNLHLEGEYLRGPQQFTITLSNNEEDLDIEIVASMREPYTNAIDRIVERAHKRFMASA